MQGNRHRELQSTPDNSNLPLKKVRVIEGNGKLVRDSMTFELSRVKENWFELARVRVIESQLYLEE